VAAERQEVAPVLRARPVVNAAAARAMARERGIDRVVWSTVGGGLLTLQLYRGGAARPRASVAVGLSGDRASAAIAGALERMVARPAVPLVVERPPPATPWYQKPWLWGVAGAVVASAILIPFVVGDSEAPGGYDLRPSGALP
jgi:hypothetical protein